jgi:uncharacterized protein YndB with AHSA1/START domain
MPSPEPSKVVGVAEPVVEVTRRIQAAPEDVFPFLTESEKYTRWKGLAADLDPRPGGVYRVQMSPDSTAVGEFVEVDPPSRVVFTGGWEGSDDVPPGSTTVEITLEADGDETVAVLRHFGLPNAHEAEEHTQGWNHYLSRLEIAGSGRDPGPDPTAAGS